ncbi:hypothetical protein F5888DRAFT_1690908 [Russula emetica]|nr:hypothetical protein F5888DRAFT_1690908 [Russula emetica]
MRSTLSTPNCSFSASWYWTRCRFSVLGVLLVAPKFASNVRIVGGFLIFLMGPRLSPLVQYIDLMEWGKLRTGEQLGYSHSLCTGDTVYL